MSIRVGVCYTQRRLYRACTFYVGYSFVASEEVGFLEFPISLPQFFHQHLLHATLHVMSNKIYHEDRDSRPGHVALILDV